MKPIWQYKKIKETNTSKNLSKIDVIKVPKSSVENSKVTDGIKTDQYLLDSLPNILRYYGIERSHASIRDMADVSEGDFDYKGSLAYLH